MLPVLSLLALVRFLCRQTNLEYSTSIVYDLRNDGAHLKKCTDNPTGHIIIPELYTEAKVTTIECQAFLMCDGLTAITLPPTLNTIQDNAFSLCRNLANLTITGKSQLKEIGNRAFSGCAKLREFTFPESLEIIRSSAFLGCRSLFSVVLPKNVSQLESNVFVGCSSLESIQVAPENRHLLSVGGVLFRREVGELLSYPIGCRDSEVKLNNVRIVGEYAFSECKTLRKLIIGENLHTISRGAFAKSNLREIYLPKSLQEIHACAFQDCESIESINLGATEAFAINECAFSGCSSLSEVLLPATLRILGNHSFELCRNLRSVALPPELHDIPDYSFHKCHSIKSIVIPSSVVRVGTYAFSECHSISEVSFEKSSKVETIGVHSFSHLYRLENLILPESVLTIDDYAFSHCGNLVQLKLCENVMFIGAYAFYNCSLKSHKNFVFSGAVRSIGRGAFGLTYIETFSIQSCNTVIYNGTFGNETDYIFVPNQCVSKFSAHFERTRGRHSLIYINIAKESESISGAVMCVAGVTVVIVVCIRCMNRSKKRRNTPIFARN